MTAYHLTILVGNAFAFALSGAALVISFRVCGRIRAHHHRDVTRAAELIGWLADDARAGHAAPASTLKAADAWLNYATELTHRPALSSALHNRDPKRWRWQVAHLLNRLPGTCWADLVSWVWGARRLPWAPVTSACRADAAACGRCYCGQIGADGKPYREPTEVTR